MKDTYCRNCGKKLKDGAVFCPDCGTEVKKTGVNTVKKTSTNKVEKTGVNKTTDQKSSKSPIILIGAGIFILFILFMVVGSAFSSDSSSNGQYIQSNSGHSNGQDDLQAEKEQADRYSAEGDYYQWEGVQDLNNQQYMDNTSDSMAKTYDFSPSPETDTATVGDNVIDQGLDDS